MIEDIANRLQYRPIAANSWTVNGLPLWFTVYRDDAGEWCYHVVFNNGEEHVRNTVASRTDGLIEAAMVAGAMAAKRNIL